MPFQFLDTQSCTAESCYPGVKCHDIPAPGTGFRCDACPAGFLGDGTICEPGRPKRRSQVRQMRENDDIVKPDSLTGLAFDTNTFF